MRRFLKIVAVNAGILVAGLLVAELIFGNWVFGPDYRQMNIPRNTVRVFDVSGLYEGGGRITYTRDEHGLRSPYPSVADIDILTLGGSTTNQLYVDDDKTWLAVMRRRLQAAGMDVSVVNAAVDGQSTRGHLAVFERWFPEIKGLHARFVLVYAGINDIALSGAESYDDMRSPDKGRQWRDWLRNKSAVYGLYKTVRGVLAAYDADVVHGESNYRNLSWSPWRPIGAPLDVSDEIRERTAGFAARLRQLAKRIEDFGAAPVFVTQPSAEYRLEDGWVLLPDDDRRRRIETSVKTLFAFNRTMLAVCEEIGVVCMDVAGEVRFEEGDFYDRIHNTDRGAEKIGVFLAERMKPLL